MTIITDEALKSREVTRTKEGIRDVWNWLVPATDGLEAIFDPMVPEPGQGHPSSPSMVCKEVHARYKDSSHYIVSATYDNMERGDTEDHQIGDVVEEADISVRREHAFVDLDGNTIGQEGEGCDVLVPHAQLVITCYVRTFTNMSSILALTTKATDGTWKGRAAGEWLCMGASIRNHTSDMMSVRWTFELNQDDSGWQYEWLPYEKVPQTVAGKTRMRKVYDNANAQTARIYETADFDTIWP